MHIPQRDDDFERVQQWALANLPAIVQDYGGVELSRAGRGPCPIHGGTNPNLSVRPGKGFKCHKCDAHGDGVEFVRLMRFNALPRNEGRVAAIRDLAPQAGVVLREPGAPASRAPHPRARHRARLAPRIVRPAPAPEPPRTDVLRGEGMIPQSRTHIYEALLGETALGPRGQAYLTGRGFVAADAEGYGFRSLDDPAACSRVVEMLAASFLPDELADAGLWDDEHQRVRFPFVPSRWSQGALVIPYFGLGGIVTTLRFRNMDPAADHKHRYRSLHGDVPSPFNWGCVPLAAGADLHITEGELNALSLMTHGVYAIGLPGAATWREDWSRTIQHVGRLVVWFDNDKGGDTGIRRLASLLYAQLGRTWLDQHAAPPQILADDANTLHQRGVLGDHLARLTL